MHRKVLYAMTEEEKDRRKMMAVESKVRARFRPSLALRSARVAERRRPRLAIALFEPSPEACEFKPVNRSPPEPQLCLEHLYKNNLSMALGTCHRAGHTAHSYYW